MSVPGNCSPPSLPFKIFIRADSGAQTDLTGGLVDLPERMLGQVDALDHYSLFQGEKTLNKPPCRITIQDLLDQMDEHESREKEQAFPLGPERMVYSLISLDDAAYFFDTDGDSLRAEMRKTGEPGALHPVPFFRDLDIHM